MILQALFWVCAVGGTLSVAAVVIETKVPVSPDSVSWTHAVSAVHVSTPCLLGAAGFQPGAMQELAAGT